MSDPSSGDRQRALAQAMEDLRALGLSHMDIMYPGDVTVRFPNPDLGDGDPAGRSDRSLPKRSRSDSDIQAASSPPLKRPCTPLQTDARKFVRERTFRLLMEHLQVPYHLQHYLPSPDQLKWATCQLSSIRAPELGGIPATTGFLKAMHAEKANAENYLPIVCLAIRSREARCRCTVGEFCPCSRKFFLPKDGPTVQEVRREADKIVYLSDALRRLGERGTDEPSECEPIPDEEDPHPFQTEVDKGVAQFAEEVKKQYQTINVIAAICSPSSYVEALLLSKSSRPKINHKLWLNPVAPAYLRNHPYLEQFEGEIEGLHMRGLNKQDIYSALLPLLHELTEKRNMPPLRRKTQQPEANINVVHVFD